MTEPTCGKCGKIMTLADSLISPELFLHDAYLPEELKPAVRETPFGMTCLEHLRSAIGWIEERKQRFHAFDCTVRQPSARCSCGLHKCLTDLRAVETFGELE